MELLSIGASLLGRSVTAIGFLARETLPQLVVTITCTTLMMLLLLVWYVLTRRRATQRLLEEAGLPTVFWTPRFWNYDDYQNTTGKTASSVLKSTSITRMLPRMERLQGPMGIYGTVYGFNTAVIHVAHPVAAKAILTQAETGASKRPAYNHFSNFCGRGVFTADGNDWRAKRVAVLHALLRGEGSLEERVLYQAQLAANQLLDCIDQEDGKSFNVVPLIQQCTIGLIFRYITHQKEIPKNVTSIRDDDKNNSAGSPSSLLHQYLESVTHIRMIILAQSRSIWFLLPRWCYAMFAPLYKQEEETMTAIRQFAHVACDMALPESPLDQIRNSPSHQHGKAMKKADDNTTQSSSSGSMVSQDLLEEAITLLFAGQDTSAATLSWTLHLLSLHPAIQTKLATEVRSVLGTTTCTDFSSSDDDDNNNDTVLSKAIIGRMPYLDAVIKESMRLYPVAPFVVRKLTQDIIVIPKNDSTSSNDHQESSTGPIRLPQSAMACLWIYGLHHHPDYWSQPEDFVPERWIQKADVGISNGAYMPFAIGPRNCLGQPLAHWILRTLLARLVQRFDFEDSRVLDNYSATATTKVDPSRDWRQDMQAGFTVLPQGGVHLIASSCMQY
ncbi:methylcoclaurine 3'-hydroxylase isozyme 1 [Seminavis robusta]|uniref:Methylcoclaurine 3'-hydroxylase isozyme 1 n=1 Tax=Seminavis robusta TaxID=568900 RepID=A0A9N8HXZ3_9STRA|nr:methylcoclaurine 3'-hydroxylase isozyme 1 [Seminavis robusta]|eukprot:Sro2669_g334270.1 methylcoclaurine 3'-hydroxylase isozyme 1 (613) ;mRNA; r:10200-12038